jgi:hypothetical protein
MHHTEHFAGVQGLFLAIPVTMYVINQIIFDNASTTATTTTTATATEVSHAAYS